MIATTPKITPTRRLLALKALPGFAELPPEELLSLGHHATVERHAAGDVLHRAGTGAESIVVLVEGALHSSQGMQQTPIRGLALAMGWEALTHEAVSYSLTCVEPSTLMKVPVDDVETLVVDRFDLYRAIVRELARALSVIAKEIALRGGSTHGDHIVPSRRERDLSLASILSYLAATPELSALPLDVLAALASEVEIVTVPAGEVLWAVGERHDSAVLPLDAGWHGSVEQQRFELPAGQLFGLEDALSGDPRWYELNAPEHAIGRCVMVPKQRLFDELEDDEDAARALLRSLAKRYVRLSGYKRLITADENAGIR